MSQNGASTFFSPTVINVTAVKTSHISISIGQPSSALFSAPNNTHIADPLQRVRSAHNRITEMATGKRAEVLRSTASERYEASVAIVRDEKDLPPPANGCCKRFTNWICCRK